MPKSSAGPQFAYSSWGGKCQRIVVQCAEDRPTHARARREAEEDCANARARHEAAEGRNGLCLHMEGYGGIAAEALPRLSEKINIT